MDELAQKKFDELIHKDLPAFSETDKAFLRARESYLTDEQKKVFKSVLKGEEPKPEPQPDLRRSRSYRALQTQAKELGLSFIGVSRVDLEKSIETALGGR